MDVLVAKFVLPNHSGSINTRADLPWNSSADSPLHFHHFGAESPKSRSPSCRGGRPPFLPLFFFFLLGPTPPSFPAESLPSASTKPSPSRRPRTAEPPGPAPPAAAVGLRLPAAQPPALRRAAPRSSPAAAATPRPGRARRARCPLPSLPPSRRPRAAQPPADTAPAARSRRLAAAPHRASYCSGQTEKKESREKKEGERERDKKEKKRRKKKEKRKRKKRSGTHGPTSLPLSLDPFDLTAGPHSEYSLEYSSLFF